MMITSNNNKNNNNRYVKSECHLLDVTVQETTIKCPSRSGGRMGRPSAFSIIIINAAAVRAVRGSCSFTMQVLLLASLLLCVSYRFVRDHASESV